MICGIAEKLFCAILILQNLTNQFIFSQNLIDCQLQLSGNLEMFSIVDRIQLEDQNLLADIDFTINTLSGSMLPTTGATLPQFG